MLHENNVMFRDMDILPDNTYTHVNNGSQTCSWMDPIAMSDVLSESTVAHPPGCCVLRSLCNYSYIKFWITMTHSIEGQKAKHINWKFEDAEFKCQFYQRLDSMLDAAPAGQLRVYRGMDRLKGVIESVISIFW